MACMPPGHSLGTAALHCGGDNRQTFNGRCTVVLTFPGQVRPFLPLLGMLGAHCFVAFGAASLMALMAWQRPISECPRMPPKVRLQDKRTPRERVHVPP